MMLARSEALKRGTPVALIATSAVSGAEFNGGWTVFVDANSNGLFDVGETIVRVQPAFRGDMRVTTSGGQTLLAFNGRGFLTPSAPVTFAVCSTLATKSYRIRVEPVGLTDVAEATGCP
jgi:type IV fimbrial biogenesis protein FimT